LSSNIFRRSARNFDPSLAEDPAQENDKGKVEQGMIRVIDNALQISNRGDIIDHTSDRDTLVSINVLPLAQKSYEVISPEALMEQLGDKEQIGNQRSLEDNGHVRSVK
jgi:hypothetical protein